MEAQVETHIAVLVAFAVLLCPVFFYLWFRWYAEKHFGPFGGDATRSDASDRRAELKESRRALRLLIEKRHPG